MWNQVSTLRIVKSACDDRPEILMLASPRFVFSYIFAPTRSTFTINPKCNISDGHVRISQISFYALVRFQTEYLDIGDVEKISGKRELFSCFHQSIFFRYKKYRIKCHSCWNIPRKDVKMNSTCINCGENLRLSTMRNPAKFWT